MPMEMPIVHPALTELTEEVKGKIKSLQSNEVRINFGKKYLIKRIRRIIILDGNTVHLSNAALKILHCFFADNTIAYMIVINKYF